MGPGGHMGGFLWGRVAIWVGFYGPVNIWVGFFGAWTAIGSFVKILCQNSHREGVHKVLKSQSNKKRVFFSCGFATSVI
jgi:hypothetical protein